MNHSSESG